MNKQRLLSLKGFINNHARFLLTFSFLFFYTTHSFSSVIIDAQCTSGSSTGEWLGTANGRQQFTPTVNGTIYKVRVHTATYGSAATITLRLFSGPTPGSGTLMTSVVYGKPAGTNSWDDVVLPGPGIVVSSGSPYYLEIAVGSQIDWIASPINVYGPGMAWRDGTSYPSKDYKFEIHMAVPTCGTVTAGANQSGVIANTPSAPLALNGGGDPGAWTTSGTGTFSDVHNPNATYTPHCSETGTLTTLTWTSSCTMTSTSQTINVAPPSLTVNNATICAGDIATLTATGASSFSWNPGGATTSSINVSPGTTATYTVTGVQGNGCTTNKIATVNVNPLPVMTSINSSIICSGGSVTIPLTASQPSSFVWLAGDNTSTTGESISNQTSSLLSNNITNISSVPQQVFYGVVPTNTTTSCQGPSQTVTVTVNPTPTITSSFGTTVCSGSSVGFNFTSNVSPTTFSWYTNDHASTTGESTTSQNNSILTDNITNLSASLQQLTYTVTPTATATGCGGSSQSFTVNVSPRPVPNAGPDIFVCSGSTQNITASASLGSPGYNYNWYDAATGGTLLATTQVYTPPVLPPGMYNFFVQVTDAVPCASTGRDPMFFTVNLNPVLSLTTTNVSCNGAANGSISCTPSGGAAPYQFSLNGGSYVSTSTFTGLPPGTYTVTTIDNNACVSSQYNTSITEPALLSSTITTSTNVSCNGGANGSATVSASGGVPSYIYSWAPSGGTAVTASGLAANTYTCTITDANACTKTQTVTINQPTPLILTTLSSTNVSCNGGSNGSASVNTATGGTPGYTYDWSPGTPTGDGTTSITGLNVNSYTCTVTDANSCTGMQVFNITEPSPLNGSGSVTNVSCNGGSNGSINTTPSGGVGPYQYSLNGGSFVGAPSFSGLVAGSYTVTIRDNNNCTVNIISSINEPTALSSSVNATGASCFGGTDGTISGTGFGGVPPYQYSLNGGAYTASSTFTGLSAGVYT
ncbi:MAG TPA: PKD-like domain-containing protein, partial [Bacteroidia bacterium]